jgi:hypothetical protein
MGVSRREFLRLVTASGITLGLSRLGAAQVPDFVARETLPGREGWNPAVGGAGRIDGVVKVTGAKLYPSGMIPVAAALLNAIFDATGKRFQSLPVTEKMLKEALS